MADINSLVESLSGLTILEVADLVKQLETKWGVSAAAPVADFQMTERVLLAEDNAVNQLVIEATLQRMGHLPRVVGDGRLAVQSVRALVATSAKAMALKSRLARAIPPSALW